MSIAMLSLLNPKTQDYEHESASTLSNIRPADIASAISYSKLSQLSYQYLLAKYCHNEKAIRILWQLIAQCIQSDIEKHGWCDAPQRAQLLALIVIYESIYAGACSVCRDKNTPNRQDTVCKRCRGTGTRPISAREQEKITRISKSSWSRIWRDRVNDYIFELQKIEKNLASIIKSQLYTSDRHSASN